MSTNHDAFAAVKQYFSGPTRTLPDGDFWAIVGCQPLSTGSTFQYPISFGVAGNVNTLFFNVVTATGALNGGFRGAAVSTGTLTNGAFVLNLNVYSYWLLQRVGDNAFLRCCYVNGQNQEVGGNPYIATASVAGIGAITLPAMRWGGAAVDADNTRWMHGRVSTFMCGTGTMTVNDFELIASGTKLNDPYWMRHLSPLCWITSTGESGNAPATISDLTGLTSGLTLASGVPTLAANDTASRASNSYSASGSGARAIYRFGGPDNVQIKGKSVSTSSIDTGADAYGIWCRDGDSPEIVGNDVIGNFPAGHCIAVGELSGAVIDAAIISGNYCRGGGYSANTPHGISLRDNTTNSQTFGNLVENTHVGYLAALTTSGVAKGNTSRKVFGPHWYGKGTTAYTFEGNLAIIGDGYPMTNNAVWAGVYGETTDITALSFLRNVVIIKNRAKLRALGQIGGLFASPSTPQPVISTGNIVLFPEEEWDPSEDLFIYTGPIDQAPNYTYAEWLTINSGGAVVTGDKIELVKQAEINKIVAAIESGSATPGFIRNLMR